MQSTSSRDRSYSSPARIPNSKALQRQRLEAFRHNDVRRELREDRVQASTPRVLQAVSVNVLQPPAAPATSSQLSHTAPALKTLSYETAGLPPTPPQGIDSTALRGAIQEAVAKSLSAKGVAPAPKDDLIAFYNILNDCLAGQVIREKRCFEIFTGVVIMLEPYLEDSFTAQLDKLEKLSFRH